MTSRKRPLRDRRGARTIPPALPRESADARARRARAIAARLAKRYPRVEIPLHHRNRLELLIATILSAQSTDAMVNRVTPALFARWRTAADYAGAPSSELETMIHSTGFFHAKARAIRAMARALLERHGGEVPGTMEGLVALPGVGRKTANVILGALGVPGIVVDTHVRRLSRRLALTAHDDPDKIEQDLGALLPPKKWSDFSLRLIYFGRELCTAVRPRCPECPLRDLCPSARYLGSPPWMMGAGGKARRTGARTTPTPRRAAR
ncbi:MAG TPA: endonuclease III [bacterium]|nr:endonuclease III [bacterium]